MEKSSYWKGGGKDALLGKAVVSPTGHVVAKNYDPKTLREGDLGLSVRVDRKFEEMTPEQRMAAGGVVDELAALLRSGVGAADDDLGFRPGMVVRATDSNDGVLGLIERITPHSVLLRVVSRFGKLILKQLPLGVWVLEECDGCSGREGLVLQSVLDFKFDENMPENNKEWASKFNWEIFCEIRSDEAVLACIESGATIASHWLAKHLTSEGLRRRILDLRVHDETKKLVFATVEDQETIVSWFRNTDWSKYRLQGTYGRWSADFDQGTIALGKIALQRLKELKVSDDILLKLREELPEGWTKYVQEFCPQESAST